MTLPTCRTCGYVLDVHHPSCPDRADAAPRGPAVALGIVPDARDILPGRQGERAPHDWYIEVCAVCGCQLGPGIGSRTRTGRCVVEAHRQAGGVVVHVQALPDGMQELTSLRTLQTLRAAGVAVAGA